MGGGEGGVGDGVEMAWRREGGSAREGGCFRKKGTCSISPSRVVPHRSTTDTRGSLTSLFGWEAVTLPDVAARTMLSSSRIYISMQSIGTGTSVRKGVSGRIMRSGMARARPLQRGQGVGRTGQGGGKGLDRSLLVPCLSLERGGP